ncbi:choice-of-anchor Q domain-containing protein [Streptomyces sp. LBL]|uniref:choice-of-anchor Q domain-containing protein n=1 Tax=Streptomyces sp. LBL TaxID=2940562 RepID=UPI0024761E30|nr:choice-of-anchor Q domain-containing protein [Streptomyces sp. LBL]
MTLAPGDAIAFRRGESWTGALSLTSSGTAEAPVTLTEYGDTEAAPPTIDGAGVCVTVHGSYWRISGLRATDCYWAGFEVRGTHNTLDSVTADHNVAGVVIGPGADHNTLRDSELTDNNKMSVNTPGGDDDSGAFGVLLNGDDNTVTGNSITGSHAISYDYGFDGAAVEVYGGDRNRVEYNTTRNNTTFTELGHDAGETADNNVFAYNVVTSEHDVAGFLVTRGADVGTGPVRHTVVVNNSVNLPGDETQGWVCYAGCSPDILMLRNNVVQVGGKTGYEDGTGADEDHGVYNGVQTQFEPGPNSVVADPLFVSATDLRLLRGSPAIERGVGVGYTTDLAGAPVPATQPDAGAYQHRP